MPWLMEFGDKRFVERKGMDIFTFEIALRDDAHVLVKTHV